MGVGAWLAAPSLPIFFSAPSRPRHAPLLACARPIQPSIVLSAIWSLFVLPPTLRIYLTYDSHIGFQHMIASHGVLPTLACICALVVSYQNMQKERARPPCTRLAARKTRPLGEERWACWFGRADDFHARPCRRSGTEAKNSFILLHFVSLSH